ncbi:MAG: alpha-L-arabinofuranosidase [Limisphaerales bacterium]
MPLPLLFGANLLAQASLPICNGYLVNGFQNWSWAAVNLSETFEGSNCVSVTDGVKYQAFYIEHAPFNTSPYSSLDFWINGGSSGGQSEQVTGLINGTNQVDYPLGPLPANTWEHFTIPLASLGIANTADCTGFWIQSSIYNSQPAFYVTGLQLLAAPAPATVHLDVNAANVIRAADTRWFGFNTAAWDSDFDTATTSNLLEECGCTTLRFPGGSLSDTYNWATDKTINDPYAWATSFRDFIQIATNIGAQVFITVNYGTGTSNEAAAWVASANITNHCNFKYWEIGNEVYGTWEVDSNTPPNDPVTYATRAAGYIQLMKAKDPTIKIGAVAVPGEDNDVNYSTEVVTNPVTGATHSGWTPVMLTTFRKMGVYPDFLIYHDYPEYTSSGSNSDDSDPLLLQVADNYCPGVFSDWTSAAQNFRIQLNDYLGPAGSNIELCVTENNSDAGAEGKQMTGIVNGLYLADSLGQLMRTEFNSLIWWDLRNGPSTAGDFDPTLYGWRPFGDEGITWGATNYPVFYAEKLLQHFIRAGDSVLNASSDYLLLSDYAVQRTNGALTLLVINKDMTTNFNAQVVLTNYFPAPVATIQSYGIAQDEAARTNGPAALQGIADTNFTGASTNFTYSFPAGTLTLFTFTPAAGQLHSSIVSPGEFILSYPAQANVPYVLQQSSNLVTWIPVSTNRCTGPVWSVTNTVSSAKEFWRVAWQP